jgi:hypothetical protein
VNVSGSRSVTDAGRRSTDTSTNVGPRVPEKTSAPSSETCLTTGPVPCHEIINCGVGRVAEAVLLWRTMGGRCDVSLDLDACLRFSAFSSSPHHWLQRLVRTTRANHGRTTRCHPSGVRASSSAR